MNTALWVCKRAPRLRRLVYCGAMFCLAMSASRPAHAAFHLWTYQELYTNSSGSLQFIELTTGSTGQNSLAGQDNYGLSRVAATTHSFTFPTNLTGNTANHTFLIGTAGIQAAGGPTPDYMIPSNFLIAGGGTISITNGGASGSYTAMPTNGTQARNFVSGTNVANSATNFAGVTGVVPEPTSIAMFASGAAILFVIGIRRRRAA